jgi:hypothetical protein
MQHTHTVRSLLRKTTHSGRITSCKFTGTEWAIVGSTQHFRMCFNGRHLSLIVMQYVNIPVKIYSRIFCRSADVRSLVGDVT